MLFDLTDRGCVQLDSVLALLLHERGQNGMPDEHQGSVILVAEVTGT